MRAALRLWPRNTLTGLQHKKRQNMAKQAQSDIKSAGVQGPGRVSRVKGWAGARGWTGDQITVCAYEGLVSLDCPVRRLTH